MSILYSQKANTALFDGFRVLSSRAGQTKADFDKWFRSLKGLPLDFMEAYLSDKQGGQLCSDVANAIVCTPLGHEDLSKPLLSVFNNINGQAEEAVLPLKNAADRILYPVQKATASLSQMDYLALLLNLESETAKIDFSKPYTNTLLTIERDLLVNVPAFPGTDNAGDLSLYDSCSLKMALAACIDIWMAESSERADLNKEQLLSEQAFLLYACDFSGIQNFISQVDSAKALRSLRVRSFYLEALMTFQIDELLKMLGLSRAHLLYAGGGRSYLLLPNTKAVKETADKWAQITRKWFIERFGILLYLATGSEPCSGNALKNVPVEDEPYTALYHQLSQTISAAKIHRYSAEEICLLNKKAQQNSEERECRVCGSLAHLNRDDKCPLCASFAAFSGSIMGEESVLLVTADKPEGRASLPLPAYAGQGSVWLTAYLPSDAAVVGGNCVAQYIKNRRNDALPNAIPIEFGDYKKGDMMSSLAAQSVGIPRVGVLRLDVDNLGNAFMHGFDEPGPDGKIHSKETLYRTVAFSRALTRFFKYDINQLLREGNDGSGYNIEIVYSGGDDVFIAGGWDDIIDAAQDIRSSFSKYTLNRLTLSGGIGIFEAKYPVYNSSQETEVLEDAAKSFPGKNAISIFDVDYTFAWDAFSAKVIGEKLQTLESFFYPKSGEENERGKAFIYRLLELLREQESDQVNLARYAYLLARMEPKRGSPEYSAYNSFSQNMYRWAQNSEDRQQLITAIYILVYRHRV